MDLATLRPADTTAVAIAAALERAEAAQAEVQQGVTDAKARRDALLLDGTPAQLGSAEKLLGSAKDLAERVEAMQQQLVARHAAAQRAELLAGLAATKAEAESTSAHFAQWWTEAEPGFRARIIEGMRMQKAARDAIFLWQQQQVAAAQRFPGAVGVADEPKCAEIAGPDWFDRLDKALRGTMSREEAQALGSDGPVASAGYGASPPTRNIPDGTRERSFNRGWQRRSASLG